MPKDVLNVLGASNHSLKERAINDYYSTDPRSTQALLDVEKFDTLIWEPCAGKHMMSDVLVKNGYDVVTTDIADYGFDDELLNFLEFDGEPVDADIVTNPPYYLAPEFVVKALEVVQPGHKVAMFLRTLFLEGTKRYEQIFKNNPPKVVYIFSNRQVCSKVDDYTEGSAVSYAWFVWEKGYKGDTVVKWLSTK